MPVHRKRVGRRVVFDGYFFALVVAERKLQFGVFGGVEAYFYFARSVVVRKLGGECFPACAERFVQSFFAAQFEIFLRRCGTYVCLPAVVEEEKVARNGVGAAVLLCGHAVGILPVAHPCNKDLPPVGCIVKRHGGVMVFAVVEPFGCFGLRIASKSAAVERAGKVLRGASAGRASGVDVAY